MPWISVKDARAKVSDGVSLQTIYTIVHSGEVKAIRLRGKILLDEDSFDNYLKKSGLGLIQRGGSSEGERVKAAVAVWKGYKKP